jgi:predicted tellurium resistance membrane protein TerC
LLTVVERYPALVDGAFVIITWVGIRLLIQYLHQVGVISWDVPEWLGYGLIVVIFVAALAWGRVEERRKGRREQA